MKYDIDVYQIIITDKIYSNVSNNIIQLINELNVNKNYSN